MFNYTIIKPILMFSLHHQFLKLVSVYVLLLPHLKAKYLSVLFWFLSLVSPSEFEFQMVMDTLCVYVCV